MNDNNNKPTTVNQPNNGTVYIPQHSAAAEVVRNQLDAIYAQAAPNQTKKEEPEVTSGTTYNRTYPNANYDWQHYHNSWQSYYQQYYQRYYLQQLYTNREQLLAEKAQAAAQSPTPIIQERQPEVFFGSNPTIADDPSKTSVIRAQLLKKVGERATKVRQSHHFVPLLSAFIVGVLFLFLQYNRVVFADVQAYVSPGSTVAATDTVLVDPTTNLNVGPDPKLIIPKINVDANVDYSITTLNDGPIQAGLRDGVVHYNLPGASSLPGQVGNTVLLGHSSNDIFDPGNSKFVFVLLDQLEQGDIFYVHYQGTRYIYRVTNKQVIQPTDLAALQMNTTKPLVTLVTCTPIGTDLRRLLVTGEQISPDPAAAKQAAPTPASTKPAAVLPGSSPTLLDRIYNFFF